MVLAFWLLVWLAGTELTNMSFGTQEVLINPELTAESGRPTGGIRGSKEYRHVYPQIRLSTLTGMLKWDAGPKVRNCSPFIWLGTNTMHGVFEKSEKKKNWNWCFIIFYNLSVNQVRASVSEVIILKNENIHVPTHVKFPLLKRLPDRRWISCMFVNIIFLCLHPGGMRPSPKVSDSNANICLATGPEWDGVGHLHRRYSLADRIHKVENQSWNNGRHKEAWEYKSFTSPVQTWTLHHDKHLWNENVLIKKNGVKALKKIRFFYNLFLFVYCFYTKREKKKKKTNQLDLG